MLCLLFPWIFARIFPSFLRFCSLLKTQCCSFLARVFTCFLPAILLASRFRFCWVLASVSAHFSLAFLLASCSRFNSLLDRVLLAFRSRFCSLHVRVFAHFSFAFLLAIFLSISLAFCLQCCSFFACFFAHFLLAFLPPHLAHVCLPFSLTFSLS